MKPKKLTLFHAALFTALAWLILAVSLVLACLSMSSCTQGILEKENGEITRIQVNTFLQKIDIEKLKTANLTLEKYSEQPEKVKVKVNPLLHNYEVEVGKSD